ncbi:MAG: hypothetical protein MUO90_01690 [Dehalococcoidales bacterium]|nr:hypothetical protein [Dehalococcoidales bacterium]
MAARVRRLKIGVALFVAASLAIVLLAPSPVVPATAYEVGSGDTPLPIQDLSLVPQSLRDEADELATKLFGNNQQKRQEFTSQLLGMYLVAKDRDVVIINNSGGWGWSSIDTFPYGLDFAAGIDAELTELGYSTLWLDFYRTPKTLNGCLSESMLALGLYPSKARDLASRVEFLTRQIPGIRVILTGESNGCTICNSAMHILKDNTQVYSIQLGPPFWNNSAFSERSLVLRSNGIIPDSFSQGNVFTVVRANLESIFGISQEHPGNILLYIGAPGHDYQWQHPGVGSQIIQFLNKCFTA